ncbi:MAG: TIGR00730 family Rossman fold protein [Planctomycetes bacterium]|nr:TIGR00730 family Rossman fold protein [Planctomycetota bacterium]
MSEDPDLSRDDRPAEASEEFEHREDHQPIDDLLERIRFTCEKLVRDRASRGDVKILSRTLRELRYAFKVFAKYRDRRKVTVFGSARTSSDAAAYRQAVTLGKAMARDGWMVVTGAGGGIMEAGHRGAGRELSMGLNIMLPFEQHANAIIDGDPKLVHMKYFFTRKLMFVKECDAVVCLPGGLGTLDEAMEVLTLLQTGKRNPAPVVLLDEPGGAYWRHLHDFIVHNVLKGGMISPEDLRLYKVTDDVVEAVDEIHRFYSVYHSMRYVRDRLVFRLRKPPSEALLAEINQDFNDILVDGRFSLSTPLSEEDEPDLAELPRLVFHFNRRNLGRLRELIDCLNRGYVTEPEKIPSSQETPPEA